LPDISKINALAIGSVSKVDGLAKASILDIDGVAVPAFLLDTYTGAAAGYSVRKLKSGVTVAARIRRSGDDIEADVEFDSNNEISLTSPISNASSGTYTDLADFVDHSTTPRDAFCVEWKDQSGNGNHATQPTAGGSGLQPKIYDASTGLVTEGGKSAFLWDGSNDYLQTSTSTQFTSHTLFMAHAPDGTGSARKFLIESTSTGNNIFNPSVEYMDSTFPSKIRQFATDSNNPAINNTTTGTYDASTRLITAQRDNTATNGTILAVDGTVTNTTTGQTITQVGNGFNLGTYRLADDRYYGGTFQEVILYNSFKNSTDVNSIELDIMTHFSIP